MSEPPGPADLERIASEVALTAAAVITAAAAPTSIAVKTSRTDVVTQIDIDAEMHIRDRLQQATPWAGILGEECGLTDSGARLRWVIDPVDGTVNLLYGLRSYAVSIAAAVDGVVVAGVVLDVCTGELFSAHLNGGATRDGERIGVSDCTELAQAMVGTGFSYRPEVRERQGAIAHRVVARARDLRCPGSTALELSWLACARLDAYYQADTAVWDRAAGMLIATEAGARIESFTDEQDDLVIAAAPGVFAALRESVVATSPQNAS